MIAVVPIVAALTMAQSVHGNCLESSAHSIVHEPLTERLRRHVAVLAATHEETLAVISLDALKQYALDVH